MRLALYCRLPEQNFWKTRLLSVLDSMKVTIQAFAELSAWRAHAAAYSGAVVVVDGPDGLTAVRTLREQNARMPMVWLADEAVFAVFAYRYRVDGFALRTANADELRRTCAALQRKGECE